MSHGVLRQTVIALLVAAPLAAADAPLRVDRPADGTSLIGGSTEVIKWSGSLDRDPQIEEWEAFLSVDGGQYYSVRITPHLDLSIREFRWTVPNVGSHDARILLRFGNEKTERAIELPLSLRIEAAVPQPAATDSVAALGEPARPGDPGVAEWAKGDRSGQHLRLVTASIPAIAPTARLTIDRWIAAESTHSGTSHAQTPTATPIRGPAARRYGSRRVAFAPDVILQSCRFNI